MPFSQYLRARDQAINVGNWQAVGAELQLQTPEELQEHYSGIYHRQEVEKESRGG